MVNNNFKGISKREKFPLPTMPFWEPLRDWMLNSRKPFVTHSLTLNAYIYSIPNCPDLSVPVDHPWVLFPVLIHNSLGPDERVTGVGVQVLLSQVSHNCSSVS